MGRCRLHRIVEFDVRELHAADDPLRAGAQPFTIIAAAEQRRHHVAARLAGIGSINLDLLYDIPDDSIGR